MSYHQVICDGCGVSAHEAGDFDAWGTPVDAVFEAECLDWVTPGADGLGIDGPGLSPDGPHYCPDCAPNQEGQADA
ncbi:hypothetical protein [Nocardia farcinica]|uniref:hypothetical protein n=1 Tax=Nocardia farcinica TaxID=37329 RepID=UPI0024540549|nr:hypothetical protein [Nocardia farcinica]